jgi:hypothetical protein
MEITLQALTTVQVYSSAIRWLDDLPFDDEDLDDDFDDFDDFDGPPVSRNAAYNDPPSYRDTVDNGPIEPAGHKILFVDELNEDRSLAAQCSLELICDALDGQGRSNLSNQITHIDSAGIAIGSDNQILDDVTEARNRLPPGGPEVKCALYCLGNHVDSKGRSITGDVQDPMRKSGFRSEKARMKECWTKTNKYMKNWLADYLSWDGLDDLG